MAIWQYDLIAIPRSAIQEAFGAIPVQISQEVLDSRNWWGDVDISRIEEFESLLPNAPSWTSAIRIWGTNDGNSIELHYSEGRLYEVKCRIDLRDVASAFIENTVRAASRTNCLLINDEGIVLVPHVEAVVKDISRSNAFSFVADPITFLNNLGPTAGQSQGD
jgi:hypothetical protein